MILEVFSNLNGSESKPDDAPGVIRVGCLCSPRMGPALMPTACGECQRGAARKKHRQELVPPGQGK